MGSSHSDDVSHPWVANERLRMAGGVAGNSGRVICAAYLGWDAQNKPSVKMAILPELPAHFVKAVPTNPRPY